MKLALIDCNYICYRAFYTMKGLEHRGAGTGTLFGFFRECLDILFLLNPDRVAFCFDHGKNLRKEIVPCYKEDRQKKHESLSKTDAENRRDMLRQIELLKHEHLPNAGFRNVLFQKGYEADDLIASLARKYQSKAEVVIVSADHDLYQLLSESTRIYNPAAKNFANLSAFWLEFGIDPAKWSMVKAIAGCSSDNVPGLKGVGEKTASAYLKLSKQDKPKHKIHTEVKANKELIKTNLQIVDLPMKGTRKKIKLKKDRVTKASWRALVKSTGMKSLNGNAPLMTSK